MLSRRLTVSALFVAGLLALSAVGQNPPADPTQPEKGKKEKLGDKAKPADPADAAVAAALANDPDVKVARAKVQLAEAELAKAKQAVVLKVMTLTANIKEYKAAVAAAQERATWAERMARAGNLPQSQLLDERTKLETAQAALARAETELKLLTGGGKAPFEVMALPDGDATTVAKAMEYLMNQQLRDHYLTAHGMLALSLAQLNRPAVKGPIPDRIREALDKTVKLGAKGEKVSFERAMEVFKKEAGLDVPVRHGPNTGSIMPIVSEGEELPIGAWFQLYQDDSGHGVFYIRDYGLLYSGKATAPPDAPTLTEFWKQKPPAAKKEGSPEPKN
jgi:hypothetical protein